MEPVFNFVAHLKLKGLSQDASTASSRAPVYAPSLSVSTGVDDLPLTAATVQWSVDSPPLASVVPVIGRQLLPSVGKFIRALNAKEGRKYQIYLLSSPYVGPLFTGYVSGQASSQSVEGKNSSMSIVPTVALGSSLGRLAAYTPYNRVFVSRGSTVNAEDWRNRSKDNFNAMDPAIFRMKWLSSDDKGGSVDILRYCRELLNEAMNIKEDEALPKDAVLDLLDSPNGVKLRHEVTPTSFVDMLTKQMQRDALNVFGRGNGLQMLKHLQSRFFFYLVPESIQADRFRMLPLLPMGKNHDAELTRDKILNMKNAASLNTLPVDRVWVPIQRLAVDFKSKTTPMESRRIENYHVYPRGENFGEDVQWTGNALMMTVPPPFLIPEVNKHAQHGDQTDPDEVQLVGHAMKRDPKAAVDHGLEEDPVTQRMANEIGDRFAKMYYAKEAFKTSSIQIDVAWHDFESYVKLLGGVFKLHLPQWSEEVDEGENVYFGQLTKVRLALSAALASAMCSLTFEYVRNQATNEEHALEEHPLYENWTKLSDYVRTDA